MIGRIHGTLVLANPPEILVDAHGVGYEISVPMSTLYELPPPGQPVTLWTHLVVREDAQLLYGFLTEGERTAFRAMIRVSGIGPRMALAVLSGLSVDDLSRAGAEQETGRLTRGPGVGKKTAGRLLQVHTHLGGDDVRQRGLARPGGPNSSTWSSASWRRRLASMKMSSCWRILR